MRMPSRKPARSAYLEHLFFSLRQRLVATRVQRTGILQTRPQVQMEELGWHLVVLDVGVLGVDRDRAATQVVQKGVEALRPRLAVAGGLLLESDRHQLAHAEARQSVGYQAAFAEFDYVHVVTFGSAMWRGDQPRLGGQGIRALVVRM